MIKNTFPLFFICSLHRCWHFNRIQCRESVCVYSVCRELWQQLEDKHITAVQCQLRATGVHSI